MILKMRWFFFWITALTVLVVGARVLLAEPQPVAAVAITDEAQHVYQKHGGAVYQVQVIDLASGKKAAIGSGFQISADGLLATNYHVVSEAIQKPHANKLEYFHENGAHGALQVLSADVIRDLALLKMDVPGAAHVMLGSSKMKKGSRLFSLGNPHDIGFTIVEGTYNGPTSETFFDKIHFSGAINPGMSGGPALNHQGEVVGVNVMTGGNQIGFLVPVEPMQALVQSPREGAGEFVKNAAARLQDQLTAAQKKTVEALVAPDKKWESLPFGPITAPGRIHLAFKCWGVPSHEEKDPYTYYWSTCSSQDSIYLKDGFDTGVYTYRYDLIEGKKDLPPPRFYSFYEESYADASESYNATEADVTNFSCNDSFTDLHGLRWKTSFCARRYIKYPKLYDAHLYMALVGMGKTGVIVTLTAQGVTQENALAFAKRFMDEIKPRVQAPVKDGAPS